jgi:CubicO group peptidase (beta-lactamase class C family)
MKFQVSIPTLLLLLCHCQFVSNTDPVTKSLEYQAWEETEQPEGSAAYLGIGATAKCLCTAVFESGRDPMEAFRNSNGLVIEDDYARHTQYDVDFDKKQATIFLGDSISRTATYVGDQGCILDIEKGLQFTPVTVNSSLPPSESMQWPMGDLTNPVSKSYSQKILDEASEAAFDSMAFTAAFLVMHKGQIIIERYRPGIDKDTQLESWSMGKSLTTTLIGRLIQLDKLSLDQKAPVPEWQQEGDPRGEITIKNLLQMSGGLRFPAYGQTRDNRVASSGSYDAPTPLAQIPHIYVYTGSINVFDFSVKRPLEFIPGSKGSGQYRNCDPLTLGYIIRNTIESDGGNYWTWPQEQLFDKIGIRRQLLETDRWGNFIMSGYDYGTARNWARIALLYLQDGMWEGQRLLPEGFVDFVSTPAESWDEPIYGGLFWINTNKTYPALPESAFAMRGGGGQNVIIVPAMDLVVVRLGHGIGAEYASRSLNKALELVVKAIQVEDT